MSELVQQIVNGLAVGAIYALIAVGYNLVYGVLGLINFAHGDVYMMGTFVVLALMGSGWPFVLAVAGGVVTGAVLSLVVERVAYRPLRNVDRIAPTVSAVGAALVLENIALRIWGPDSRAFDTPLPNGTYEIHGVIVRSMHLVVIGVAAVLALTLYLLVTHTQWGRMVRAIRDDMPTAELMGLPVNRVVSSVYAAGGALGVIAGVLYGAYFHSIFVTMGFQGTLFAFTAAVIGGIGSISGSFVGGLLLGLIQAIGVGYLSSGYINAITFAALIAILLLRPHGLLGKAEVVRA